MMHSESNVSLIFLKYRLSITNPSPVFKSLHLSHDSAQNSAKFIISSKFTLQVFHWRFFIKKTIEYLSCKLLPNCTQFRNALETSRNFKCHESNKFCLNFRFVKFFLVSKRSCPQASIFVLLQKGDFPQKFLLRASKKIFLTRE